MVKNPPANAGDIKDAGFDPWVGEIPWRRGWKLTLVFLPGESQGQRSLAGYSPWAPKASDRTERLTLSLLLSHLGSPPAGILHTECRYLEVGPLTANYTLRVGPSGMGLAPL